MTRNNLPLVLIVGVMLEGCGLTELVRVEPRKQISYPPVMPSRVCGAVPTRSSATEVYWVTIGNAGRDEHAVVREKLKVLGQREEAEFAERADGEQYSVKPQAAGPA